MTEADKLRAELAEARRRLEALRLQNRQLDEENAALHAGLQSARQSEGIPWQGRPGASG